MRKNVLDAEKESESDTEMNWEKIGMTDMLKKKKTYTGNKWERRKRQLQLFIQLLSSGCIVLTPVGSCLCPWLKLYSSVPSQPPWFNNWVNQMGYFLIRFVILTRRTLWFKLITSSYIPKSFLVPLKYSCGEISMQCCVLLFYTGPSLCFKKVNSSRHRAVPRQRWPCMRGRDDHSIYQHHMMHNGAISCSSIRLKGRPAQLSISHSGARGVRRIQKIFGQRDVKGSLQQGLSACRRLCVCVCVCECVCGLFRQEHFSGPASTIRTDKDVFFRLLLCDDCNHAATSPRNSPKNPPVLPFACCLSPLLSRGVLWPDIKRAATAMLRNPIGAELWCGISHISKTLQKTHFELY